jgi:hypothetical protein
LDIRLLVSSRIDQKDGLFLGIINRPLELRLDTTGQNGAFDGHRAIPVVSELVQDLAALRKLPLADDVRSAADPKWLYVSPRQA